MNLSLYDILVSCKYSLLLVGACNEGVCVRSVIDWYLLFTDRHQRTSLKYIKTNEQTTFSYNFIGNEFQLKIFSEIKYMTAGVFK